jgi:hypothetical protein
MLPFSRWKCAASFKARFFKCEKTDCGIYESFVQKGRALRARAVNQFSVPKLELYMPRRAKKIFQIFRLGAV